MRQLENLIEKLVIICDDIIEITDLPTNFLKNDRSKVEIESSSGLNETLKETRKYLVRKSNKKYRNSRKVTVDLKTSQTTAS